MIFKIYKLHSSNVPIGEPIDKECATGAGILNALNSIVQRAERKKEGNLSCT